MKNIPGPKEYYGQLMPHLCSGKSCFGSCGYLEYPQLQIPLLSSPAGEKGLLGFASFPRRESQDQRFILQKAGLGDLGWGYGLRPFMV